MKEAVFYDENVTRDRVRGCDFFLLVTPLTLRRYACVPQQALSKRSVCVWGAFVRSSGVRHHETVVFFKFSRPSKVKQFRMFSST